MRTIDRYERKKLRSNIRSVLSSTHQRENSSSVLRLNVDRIQLKNYPVRPRTRARPTWWPTHSRMRRSNIRLTVVMEIFVITTSHSYTTVTNYAMVSQGFSFRGHYLASISNSIICTAPGRPNCLPSTCVQTDSHVFWKFCIFEAIILYQRECINNIMNKIHYTSYTQSNDAIIRAWIIITAYGNLRKYEKLFHKPVMIFGVQR